MTIITIKIFKKWKALAVKLIICNNNNKKWKKIKKLPTDYI